MKKTTEILDRLLTKAGKKEDVRSDLIEYWNALCDEYGETDSKVDIQSEGVEK